MIKPKQIPIAVVQALRDFSNTCDCDECTAETVAAVLNAWPMVHIHEWQRPWLKGIRGTDIILPLETSND